MIRRPPRSTLFPTRRSSDLDPENEPGDGCLLLSNDFFQYWLGGYIYAADAGLDAEGNVFSVKDRKSTRLNSSHANISYAVFCLKKKNRNKLVSVPCLSVCNL